METKNIWENFAIRDWWGQSYLVCDASSQEILVGDNQWVAGAGIVVLFGPWFYLSLFHPSVVPHVALARMALGVAVLVGVACLGYYSRAVFSKRLNTFQYRTSFFGLPINRMKGPLDEIHFIQLRFTKIGGKHRLGSRTSEVAVQFKQHLLPIATGGSRADLSVARHLSVLLRVPLKVSGLYPDNRIAPGNEFTETPEEAWIKLESKI